MVLRRENEFAVIRVEKEDGTDLFRPITDIEIISLPATTRYVEAPKVNVLNPYETVALYEEALKKDVGPDDGSRIDTLVIKGEFEHISFVHDEERVPLHVVDVVPPHPSKLLGLVDHALTLGSLDVPVKPITHLIDAKEMASHEKGKIMFPCSASSLEGEGGSLFLDQTPKLTKGDIEGITLVGCTLSKRIFISLYKKKPRFINFCPQDLIEQNEVAGIDEWGDGYIISKCCRVSEGFELNGKRLVVPWGANMKDVLGGLEALFSTKKQDD